VGADVRGRGERVHHPRPCGIEMHREGRRRMGLWWGALATSSFTMRLRNGARSAAAMAITSAGSRARTSPCV